MTALRVQKRQLLLWSVVMTTVASAAVWRDEVAAQENVTLPAVEMPSLPDAGPVAMPAVPSAAPPSPQDIVAQEPAALDPLPMPDLPALQDTAAPPQVEPAAPVEAAASPTEVVPAQAEAVAPSEQVAEVPTVPEVSAAPTDEMPSLPNPAAAQPPMPQVPVAPTPAPNSQQVVQPGAAQPQPQQQPGQQMASKPADPVLTQVAGQSGLSIGSFGLSLMYSTEDINNLKQVLEVFEAVRSAPTTADPNQPKGEADLLAELLRASQQGEGEAVVELPTELPSFYVGTILYRGGKDWSVWVNGNLFNGQKRKDEEMGVRVKEVGREQVVLAWTPENPAQAFKRYEQAKKLREEEGKPKAKTDTKKADKKSTDEKKSDSSDVAQTPTEQADNAQQNMAELVAPTDNSPIQREKSHREARTGQIRFSKEKGEYLIWLRANQTFVGNSMQIMEGKFTSTAIAAPAPGGDAVGGDTPAANSAAAAMPAQANPERNIANELLGNLQQIGNMMPGGAAASATPPMPQLTTMPGAPGQ